jgi:hypothetical protein
MYQPSTLPEGGDCVVCNAFLDLFQRLREAEDEEHTDDEGLESCDSVGSGIGDELSFTATSDVEEMCVGQTAWANGSRAYTKTIPMLCLIRVSPGCRMAEHSLAMRMVPSFETKRTLGCRSGTAMDADGGEGGDGARDTGPLASDEVAANTALVADGSDSGATDAAGCAMPEAAGDGGDAADECPDEGLVACAPTSESPAADEERQEGPQAAVSEDDVIHAPSEEQAEDQPLADVPVWQQHDEPDHAR